MSNSVTLGTVAHLCPGDSPGKNPGVGCHAPLQGSFPTQWLNPCLLHLQHCRWILYSEPPGQPLVGGDGSQPTKPWPDLSSSVLRWAFIIPSVLVSWVVGIKGVNPWRPLRSVPDIY